MDARDKLKAHPVTGAGLSAYGTQILVNIVNASGGLPLCNGRDGAVFDQPTISPARPWRPNTSCGTRAASAALSAADGP